MRSKRKQVIQGKLFIRISAWVYNEPNDYVRLAKVSIDYSVRQTHRINHIGVVLCVKFSEPDRQSNKHVPHRSEMTQTMKLSILPRKKESVWLLFSLLLVVDFWSSITKLLSWLEIMDP